MEAVSLKKKTLGEWTSYLFSGAIVVNYLAMWFDLIEIRTFGLVLLLLLGINQLWNSWREYQENKRFEGMVLVSFVIGVATLGLFISSFF